MAHRETGFLFSDASIATPSTTLLQSSITTNSDVAGHVIDHLLENLYDVSQ
jgi:hypothetical protein